MEKQARSLRKMGHLNVVTDSLEESIRLIKELVWDERRHSMDKLRRMWVFGVWAPLCKSGYLFRSDVLQHRGRKVQE